MAENRTDKVINACDFFGDWTTLSQIAKHSGIDETNISRIVNPLIKSGYLNEEWRKDGIRSRKKFVKRTEKKYVHEPLMTNSQTSTNGRSKTKRKTKRKPKSKVAKLEKIISELKKKVEDLQNNEPLATNSQTSTNGRSKTNGQSTNGKISKVVKIILDEFDLIKCYFRTGKRPAQDKAISNFISHLKMLGGI